ncbi:MAG TPA: hypothetical protein DCS67_11230, partial [Clostridiales bacterium UBA8960]|nr:hypothetical protein [Clostridiales bacterium UBA8960]
MKRVALKDLQKDVVINQNLYDPRFNILVQRGTVLNDKMLEALSYYGYLSIFVKTENEKNDEHPSLPYEEINALIKLIKNAEIEFTTYYSKRQHANAISHYKKYIEKRDLFVQKSQRLAEDIILYLVKNQIRIYQIFESKSLKLYGTQHAIQTALLSVLMGIDLKLTMQELKILFNSAIMMEFGNIIIPKSILEKQGRLTTEEFEFVKAHTAFYSKEFNDCDKMHYLVRIVTQQHHERFNGSGYPLGLKKHEIHPLAQIMMV